jgi:restriction system protein
MAVWLVRAGQHGSHEQKFLQESRVYVTWDSLSHDLSPLKSRAELEKLMREVYPETKPKAILNWSSQVWPFVHDMKKGDLVMVPLKSQPSIQVGELTGDYQFNKSGPDPYFHWRAVKWLGEPVPRDRFAKDILLSLGAFMTICRIQRNNAETRINAMRANGWKPETVAAMTQPEAGETDAEFNLEELANDQIAKLLLATFKGHGLARLVEGILKAQGYTTYRSPEGADGGVDILAGQGQLGFGNPRLCVEVKSGDSPVDRPTVDKLLGAMTKFGAQEGLFVSWAGYKPNVPRELAATFFRVRLWTRTELLEQLFANYEKLDEDLRAELPLKRIWTVTAQDDE